MNKKHIVIWIILTLWLMFFGYAVGTVVTTQKIKQIQTIEQPKPVPKYEHAMINTPTQTLYVDVQSITAEALTTNAQPRYKLITTDGDSFSLNPGQFIPYNGNIFN